MALIGSGGKYNVSVYNASEIAASKLPIRNVTIEWNAYYNNVSISMPNNAVITVGGTEMVFETNTPKVTAEYLTSIMGSSININQTENGMSYGYYSVIGSSTSPVTLTELVGYKGNYAVLFQAGTTFNITALANAISSNID